MTKQQNLNHVFAVLQALLVTFLWSTSFIIIKWELTDLPPITYAGLRYTLAFLCFLPYLLKQNIRREIQQLNSNQWQDLIWLGIIFYTLTQGLQFLGLSLVPAVTVSLVLNFTPLIVAAMGYVLLDEKPSTLQWSGAILFILGILTYFYPVSFKGNQGLGFLVMSMAVLANSGSAILGRKVNRNQTIRSIVVTFISMGIGAFILLGIGLLIEGIPSITNKNWVYLGWLAVVNTAIAFTLWNHTLRSLKAMESSIINGTMLIQIAILAWFFLDEKITVQQGIGMGIATVGAVLVQLKTKIRDQSVTG